MADIGLISLQDDLVIANYKTSQLAQLSQLAQMIQCTLIRYACVLKLISLSDMISRENLEAKSQQLAKQLAELFDINTPEFFDKKVLSGFINALKSNQLIDVCQQGKITDNQATLLLSNAVTAYLEPNVASALETGLGSD